MVVSEYDNDLRNAMQHLMFFKQIVRAEVGLRYGPVLTHCLNPL